MWITRIDKLACMVAAIQAQSPEQRVVAMYSLLARTWGRQHWWPAQSRFEMIVGAFLTQNTSWSNVEIAMRSLRSAKVLSLHAIRRIHIRKLERLIRSSGYFRQKAARLKTFIHFLDRNYGGSLAKMFTQETARLREQLLSLNGIGPETADSILLYAGQHPIFVVDAYTKRIASRHEIIPSGASYEEVRTLFERALAEVESIQKSVEQPGGAYHAPSRMSRMRRSREAQVYNEMHGLLVGVGKQYCLNAAPRCDSCPLKPLLARLSA